LFRSFDKIGKPQLVTGATMTRFQLLCGAAFVAATLLVYRAQLMALVRAVLGAPRSSVPVAQPSIAVNLVNDLVAVTQLRDRLAAEGCKEGVDACTVLLRVIVEFQEPSKGVV
jgi:hypothetical protein